MLHLALYRYLYYSSMEVWWCLFMAASVSLSLYLSTTSNTSKRFFNENKGFGALILAATLYFFRSWEPLEKLRWRHKKYQELVMRRQMMLLFVHVLKNVDQNKTQWSPDQNIIFSQKNWFDKITTSVSHLILRYTRSSNR